MAARSLPEKFVSIYVECVATGRRHDALAVAEVAVMDQDECVLLEKKVKPKEKVMSYLTPLTGIREGDLDDGEPLEKVVTEVKGLLGPDVVLVGQCARYDVAYLQLREGEDYKSVVELSELFKTFNPRYGDHNFYSLKHEANTLLRRGFIGDEHDPVTDAKAGILLFKKYYANSAMLQEAKQKLLRTRPPASWAGARQNNYRWEGVCVAAYTPSKCFCGAPTKKTS